MPINYSREAGPGMPLTEMTSFSPFEDSDFSHFLRQDTRFDMLRMLSHGEVAFSVQELDTPEGVLKVHNHAWVNSWKQKEWTDEQYKAEFEVCTSTGFYANGVTSVAIIDTTEEGYERDLLEFYLNSARFADDGEITVTMASPDMSGYEPAPRPMKLTHIQPTDWDRFRAYITGIPYEAPTPPEMVAYTKDEERRMADYRRSQIAKLQEEYDLKVAKIIETRRRENPDGLPGFTTVYVTQDEVTPQEDRGIVFSDEILLLLISGYTVLVGKPGEVTEIILPLRREEADKIKVEREI